MKSMFKLYSAIVTAVVVCSCGGNEPAENTTGEKDSTGTDIMQEQVVNPAGPFSAIERSPKNVYEADSIRIESYDFEHLEPFLHATDPTRIYVVNFWATWCVPCVAELPYFEQLGENYKASGVHVLLVSIDFAKAVQDKLIPFIREKKLKSEVVLLDDPDANSWISKVDENWSGAIPATVVYSNEKRSFHEGSMTYEELEQMMQEYLAE
jgi:thiol-disulfide isomerase/thioredoxin